MTKTFRIASARLTIQPVKNSSYGVFEVIASGLICRNTYEQFRSAVTEPLSAVSAYVLRLDGAAVAMSQYPDYESMTASRNTPSSAIVVQPEIFDFWVDYARILTGKGFVRSVFLVSNVERAYRFAELQAKLRVESDFQSLE